MKHIGVKQKQSMIVRQNYGIVIVSFIVKADALLQGEMY